ncbi:MAG: hypothetical protein H0U64_03575 [Gemmatimonadaceae bacterium]|nr:hypothetical protein [Gemmatimonadaceae bacterium]
MNALKLTAAAIFVFAGCAAAQTRAATTPYLPLDDIGYRYIEALHEAPGFRSLSAIERPYTVGQIRIALDSAINASPSRVVRSFLDALSGTITKYEMRPSGDDPEAPRALFSGELYGTAQTSGRRDLMLADTGTSVLAAGSLRMLMAGGPIVGAIRVEIDPGLNHDPEFGGRKDRTLAARTRDGYLLGRWNYGELFFGRAERNWGPQLFPGLQLGNYAYTYDHFYGRFGSDRLHFSMVTARLENYVETTGREFNRYFSIHRLGGRLGKLELAFTESYVYGGVGRGLEFSLINPLNAFGLSWRDENVDGNLNFGFESSYRTDRFGTFGLHALIDDYQIDDCDTTCNEPSSLGLTLSAERLPVAEGLNAFAAYTRVSSLTYRTPRPDETYSIHGIGLGRGFSDYDEWRVGVDVAYIPRVPLRAYVASRRKGEGDYRSPYPQRTALDQQRIPGLFIGSSTKVTRVGVSGGGFFSPGLRVNADLGYNSVSPDVNALNLDKSGFEGRIRVAFEPRWGLKF